ncbi:MAG: glycogen debranching protein GlgX [Planctomycetaceae bacterium]|jgi:glycogen operon protein|nr:glycogen debranching protein GlgX [Planctomycetaceae bacterium]
MSTEQQIYSTGDTIILANPHWEHSGMFERPHALRFTYSLPYGAILRENGVQFVVMSRSATSMKLLLYDDVKDSDPSEIIAFDREENRWGDVWSIFVPGIGAGQLYHYQADGPFDPQKGQRFDGKARLIDPYAKALAGDFLPPRDGVLRPPKCVVIDDDNFNWHDDRHIKRDLSETIIYEMHVHGFTQSKNSGVKSPGTYLGVIEKIPYLQSLGVTAVELMPIHEFPILDTNGQKKINANYWGYDTMAFFSPHRGYASGGEPGSQVREFKEMVRALHQAGIEVILDVVYNHTCEGNEHGPTLSFKGLENRVYYMLENGMYYKNYSGCGNTVNGNHPIVREMIFNSLRHWVHNYHIDGFRFDLASIFSRDQSGSIIPNPPTVETIQEDPLLADTKIIAEAWDAAGAYQVGSFGNRRWAEWNGKYRDDVRKFWRCDPHMTGAMATRLSGSSDLYQHNNRSPFCSINLITSHDGFTLNDLVSYNGKHNEANGENNRDGDNNNYSCNYGVEGPTWKRDVEAARIRQIKNMLATLLLSQGVPMLVSGDECRRTQRGNNNAYCQNNIISWFDWKLPRKHEDILRFCRSLIMFRRQEPIVRQRHFLTGQPPKTGRLPDVSWYGPSGGNVNWGNGLERSLICLLSAMQDAEENTPSQRHLLMMCHAGTEPQEFRFPDAAKKFRWQLFLDTSAQPPNDIYPNLDGPLANVNKPLTLESISMRVFLAACDNPSARKKK